MESKEVDTQPGTAPITWHTRLDGQIEGEPIQTSTQPAKRSPTPRDQRHPCRRQPPNTIVQQMEISEVYEALDRMYEGVLASDPGNTADAINAFEHRVAAEAALAATASLSFEQAVLRYHAASTFIVAQDSLGRVLILDHNVSRGDRTLGVPGGKVGDTAATCTETQWEAACREFREESEFEATLSPWAVDFFVNREHSRKIVVVYFCRAVVSGDAWSGGNREIYDRIWFDPAELFDRLAVESDQPLYPYCRRAFTTLIPILFRHRDGMMANVTLSDASTRGSGLGPRP
ncbi:NUDIX domain [Carpediemonas membranifera]|uniref:NUDIX domain n=1 Tax=Carpediemonas membranifera TaxID=201153 RepID=A0A8J6AS84_9EUKA|nr:NUDIX domain [Carpediemonas membranifera]|eukprot:KAG9390180.1 NUDIX domain [Carpediemonas membranifera]